MKTKILIPFLCACSLIGGACTQQNQPVNNTVSSNPHAGMNHNVPNQPASRDAMKHDAVNHGAMNHSAMQSSIDAAHAPFDLQFLDTMVAHHQGAVEMAKPAAEKAQHIEIKTLAQSIVKDQEKEIAQMREWREKWFAGKPAAMNMEMAGMADSMRDMDMKKLELSEGVDFDLEFIKQMIPHHEGAVVMAQEALQKSQKEEIKTLANAIIKAQAAEIKQMNDWQRAWQNR